MHFEYNYGWWKAYVAFTGMKIFIGISIAFIILPFRDYSLSEIKAFSFFIICFVALCLYSRYEIRNVYNKLVWDGDFITLSNKHKELEIQVVNIKKVKILYAGNFLKFVFNDGSSARLQVDLFNNWSKVKHLIQMVTDYPQQSK